MTQFMIPTQVQLTAREDSKAIREIRSSFLTQNASDVITSLWHGLNVPAFKGQAPLFAFDNRSKVHLLSDNAMIKFLDERTKTPTIKIMKGMSAEQKFIIAAVDVLNCFSHDMRAVIRSAHRSEDMDRLWKQQPGVVLFMATGSGVVMATSRTHVTDSCERNLLDMSGDLSLPKMLSLLTGDRLVALDFDGEMIGLALEI